MTGRPKDLFGGPRFTDMPGVEDNEGVGSSHDEAEIMGDQKDSSDPEDAKLLRRSMMAWVVTASSGVVGSSASSMDGDRASARAITTRCLIPPLSSCGTRLRHPEG